MLARRNNSIPFQPLELDKNQKMIVCSNGNSFMSTRSFTPNTWSFMYANRMFLTTSDVLERQLKCKLTMVRR